MWRKTAGLLAALAIWVGAAPAQPTNRATKPVAQAEAKQNRPAPRKKTPPLKTTPPLTPPPLPCGDYLGFQVLLDRQGFSPGVIDGKPGDNFTHALAAMQASRKLQVTSEPDCDSWHSLGGDHAEPTIATYTITDDDVKGPFEAAIPRELVAQATLPALAYQSPLEELAERFHASQALLKDMNVGIAIEAGRQISVPAVQPFDPQTKPEPTGADDLTIQVTKQDSALRATKSDGAVVFFAPVTTGSEHDPLPTGEWKVTDVYWWPEFHYNPNLFWDANPADTKATIKPGPNNPVGVVWVGLTLEHYGLHGTPVPEQVGHTQSHGCVRLTNWDAARVAAVVKPGTPVLFR